MAKRPPSKNSRTSASTKGNAGASARGTGAPKRKKKNIHAGSVTTSRAAKGRERQIVGRGHEPAWFVGALDAIARARATGAPLDRALKEATSRLRLGGKERKNAGDAAFAWARKRAAIEAEVKAALKRHGGVAPTQRDQDRAQVLIALAGLGAERPTGIHLPAPLSDVVDSAFGGASGGAVEGLRAQLPAWLQKRLNNRYLDAAPALVEALTSPAPVVISFDARHVDKDALIEALNAIGAQSTPSPVSPFALRLDRRIPLKRLPKDMVPHVWPMDDGSRAVVDALGVSAGQRVLDLCAGGGGKTRALCAMGATVVAADINPRRLEAAKKRAPEVEAWLVADGTKPPFAMRSFDAILIDAPCTGVGTLRRAPDRAHRLRESEVATYAKIQRGLVAAAAGLLRPGGRLVYATCSLLPAENEDVIDTVLEDRPELRPAPLREGWTHALRPDVHEEAARHVLLPSKEGTDGFFVAALTKVENAQAPTE